MNFKGERFHIPLVDDNNEDGEDEYDKFEQAAINATARQNTSIPSLAGFVKDIQERPTITPKPPTAPALKESQLGFPAHKKRYGASKFKQARTNQGAEPNIKEENGGTPPSVEKNEMGFAERDMAAIDMENRKKLASMSPDAIERERKELLEHLSPSLVQRLMRRANIDADTGPADFGEPNPSNNMSTAVPVSQDTSTPSNALPSGGEPKSASTKRVTFETPTVLPCPTNAIVDADGTDGYTPQELEAARPITSIVNVPQHNTYSGTIHFPRNPAVPDLDPSSPSFLADLHNKYFPSLPSDPSKLAWMTDPSTLPTYESSYSPEADSIPTSALRFSFRGMLIPPRRALAIPVTEGLHHHGDAPKSAGYTIPELAHLSRSAFPAQRCVSFQTLGRVMYRLGRGEFGNEDSELAKGLWFYIQQGRVLDTLHQEVEREGGHQSAKAYATEALWLWQKGGGQKVKAQ